MTRIVTEWAEVESELAAVMHAGQPVIIPTDTVYGLAARALDVEAVSELFVLKQRPPDLSIAALVADIGQAREYADIAAVEPLLEAWWPGALTVIVPKRTDPDGIALPLGASDGTIGLRSPAHSGVQALARVVGPIAATSANISGSPTLVNVEEITREFGDAVAIVVDEGPLIGQASTVAKVVDGQVVVLREGALSQAQLQATLDQHGA